MIREFKDTPFELNKQEILIDGEFFRVSEPGIKSIVGAAPKFIFSDDTTAPNQDPSNKYDTATGLFKGYSGNNEITIAGGFRQVFVTNVGFTESNHRLRIEIIRDVDSAIIYSDEIPMAAPLPQNNPFVQLSHTFIVNIFPTDDYFVKLNFLSDSTSLNTGLTQTTDRNGGIEDGYMIVSSEFIGYATTLTHKNHVPDILVKDLLLALKGMNIVLTFSDSSSDISLDWANVELDKNKTINLSDKIISDRLDSQPVYELDTIITSGFDIGYNLDSTDKTLSDSNTHTRVVEGNGETEITPQFTPMMMSVKDGIGSIVARVLVPTRHETGTSQVYSVSANFPLKLFISSNKILTLIVKSVTSS